MAVLKISKVVKSYGHKIILNDITLEAKSGDIVGLIGKSGCGKSTLLKILVGHHSKTSGDIYYEGRLIDNKDELKKLVGYTTQENSFYEKLSLIENMRYYARLYNVANASERIVKLLTYVGLIEHKNKLAENISGGMKRRLDFAISLIHKPSILVLDEPTTGLDPILIEQFWDIIKRYVSENDSIVIVSSHILFEVEKYCNKVAIMNNGKVVKFLTKSEIHDLSKTFKEYVKK